MSYTYTKTAWENYLSGGAGSQDNAKVTSAKLNKMETGIANATIEYVDTETSFGDTTYASIEDDDKAGERHIKMTYKASINDEESTTYSSYSAAYIKAREDINSKVATSINNGSLLQRIEELESRLTNLDNTIYGVRWSTTSTDPQGERVNGSVGFVSPVGTDKSEPYNDFDAIYPFRDMIRCNGYLDSGLKNIYVTAYDDGDPNFSINSNGNVWVEIPKFYYSEYTKDGYYYINISENKVDNTYRLPSKFVLGNGTELDKVYISAYKLSISGGRVSSKAKTMAINTEDTMYYREALSNGEQSTGDLSDKSYGSILSMCNETNENLCGLTTEDLEILYVLCSVEFATRDLSTIMKGVCNLSDTEISLSGDSVYYINSNILKLKGVDINTFYTLSNSLMKDIIDNNYMGATIKISSSVTKTSTDEEDGSEYTYDVNEVYYRAIENVYYEDDVLCMKFFDEYTDAYPIDESEVYEVLDIDSNDPYIYLGNESKITIDAYSNGSTERVLSPSGSIGDNTSGNYPCRYRYIENPWGNQFDVLYQTYVSYDESNSVVRYAYNKSLNNVSEASDEDTLEGEDDSGIIDDSSIKYIRTAIKEEGVYDYIYSLVDDDMLKLPNKLTSTETSYRWKTSVDLTNCLVKTRVPIAIGCCAFMSKFDMLNANGNNIIFGNLPGLTDDDNKYNSLSSRLSYSFS